MELTLLALWCLRDDELCGLQLCCDGVALLDQHKLLQVEVLLLLQLLLQLLYCSIQTQSEKNVIMCQQCHYTKCTS